LGQTVINGLFIGHFAIEPFEGETDARIALAFVLHWKEVKTHPLTPPIQAFWVENHHGTTSAKPQVMYENQHV